MATDDGYQGKLPKGWISQWFGPATLYGFLFGAIFSMGEATQSHTWLTDTIRLEFTGRPLNRIGFVLGNVLVMGLVANLTVRGIKLLFERGCFMLFGGLLIAALGLVALGLVVFADPIGLDSGQRIMFAIFAVLFCGLGGAIVVSDARARRDD